MAAMQPSRSRSRKLYVWAPIMTPSIFELMRAKAAETGAAASSLARSLRVTCILRLISARIQSCLQIVHKFFTALGAPARVFLAEPHARGDYETQSDLFSCNGRAHGLGLRRVERRRRLGGAMAADGTESE